MTSQTVDRYVPEWTLADRLRRIRRDTGKSQVDFAVSIGAGPKAYASWEADRNSPRGPELVALAKRIELAYGVSAAWTLGLHVPPKDGPDSGAGVPVTGGSMDTHRYPHRRAA
jgi:transcriptional regulator with XRE-family HTH domain